MVLDNKQKIIVDNEYLLGEDTLSLTAFASKVDKKFNEKVISYNIMKIHDIYEHFSGSNDLININVSRKVRGDMIRNITVLGINKDGFNCDCIRKLTKNGVYEEKQLTTDFASNFIPGLLDYSIYINETDKRDIVLKRLKVAVSLLKDIEQYISLDEIMKDNWAIISGKSAIYDSYMWIRNETNGDKLIVDLSGLTGKIQSYVYHKNV